jgi:hypothetical protein
MKTRERLKRIRESKSWTERRRLAKDHWPGTPFDGIIDHWMEALREMDENGLRPPKRESYLKSTGVVDLAAMNHDLMAAIGEDFARAFKNGKSTYFRDWADAVEKWKNHKPCPDNIRLKIIEFCLPRDGIFSVRKILSNLRESGIEIGPETPRIVRRICAELKIRTDHKSGAPKKPDRNG